MEEYCKYQQRLLEGMPHPVHSENSLLQVFNNLISLLGLKWFWRKTYFGLKLQVAQLQHHGQQLEALNLLLHALRENNFWRDHAGKWWHLMRLSVSLSQDLHLDTANKITDPIRELLKLSGNGPQPWKGYDVAYSFASFSLWSFQFGKTQKAIEQVNVAVHADPSWGYPEYLLGWYGLILEGIDPVVHFVRAIKMNWSFFEKLKQDPLCQQYPEVLHAVKSQVLIKT